MLNLDEIEYKDFIRVTWLDSSILSGWQTLEQIKAKAHILLHKCTSYGTLIYKTDEMIVMANSVTSVLVNEEELETQSIWGNIVVIPVGCIDTIKKYNFSKRGLEK